MDMLIVSDMLKVKMKICLFVCIPDMKIENTTGHIMAQVGRFICTYFSIFITRKYFVKNFKFKYFNFFLDQYFNIL